MWVEVQSNGFRPSILVLAEHISKNNPAKALLIVVITMIKEPQDGGLEYAWNHVKLCYIVKVKEDRGQMLLERSWI